MRDAADEEDQHRGFRPEFIVAVERRGFVASLFEFAIGRLGVEQVLRPVRPPRCVLAGLRGYDVPTN